MPLLNTADAVYLGGSLADAVYLGADKVWPKAVAPAPGTVSGYWDHLGTTTSTPSADGQSRYRGSNTTFRFASVDDDGIDHSSAFVDMETSGVDSITWNGTTWPVTAVTFLSGATPPQLQLEINVTGGAPDNVTGRHFATITPTPPGYVTAALNLGADVMVDGDTDLANSTSLNGTGITTGSGPDGLTMLTGGTDVSIAMPSLGNPANGWTVAVVVQVSASVTDYVDSLWGAPLMADNTRGISHRNDGVTDHRLLQRSNVNASALNSDVNANGHALIVGRADVLGTVYLGTTLTVRWDGVEKRQVIDDNPLPTILDWTTYPTQKIGGDLALMPIGGVAIWHDRVLTDAEIATLHAALPSV